MAVLFAVSFCFREGNWTIGVKNEVTETPLEIITELLLLKTKELKHWPFGKEIGRLAKKMRSLRKLLQ